MSQGLCSGPRLAARAGTTQVVPRDSCPVWSDSKAGGLNPQPTAGCGRPALRPQGPPVAHALPEAAAESGSSTAGRDSRPCASRCRTGGDKQKITGSSWRFWSAEAKTQTAQEEE